MVIEVTYVDHMGTDLTVANAARVSFGKKSEMDSSDPWGPPFLKVKDAKLIHYLAKHKHISPFGHCFASFHIKAPVFVARQLVKHKFLRWNEISRRYVDSEPEFYTPPVWRGRSANKKQGSEGTITISDDIVEDLYDDTVARYRLLLDIGVCPEQARMILPQSMMTEWYWSGSLDAFADMCKLRYADDTQAETREVAEYIAGEMYELFPVSWEALVEIEHER